MFRSYMLRQNGNSRRRQRIYDEADVERLRRIRDISE